MSKTFLSYLANKYNFSLQKESKLYQEEIKTDVYQVCSDFLNIPLELLGGKSRANTYKVPRFVAMWYLCIFKKIGLKDIGNAFGGRDHSTVINARDKIQDAIDTKDPLYARYFMLMKPLIPEEFWNNNLLWVDATQDN